MNNKFVRSIFWAMAAVFIIVICAIFLDIPVTGSLPGYILFIGIALFLLLGTALIVLTVKTKVVGKIKRFLLLTGASAAGLSVFVVLHNLVSGLLNLEEAVFFILATIVCPLVFLAGVIGTIILTVKTKSSGGIA
jgi:hypothetical protein